MVSDTKIGGKHFSFLTEYFLQGGVSAGYKKFIADKDLEDETYSVDNVALIKVSGTSVHNNKAVQVDAVCAE